MKSGKRILKCLLCQGGDFQEETGKIDSSWGITAHKVAIKICKECGYVMLFGQGRTVWDFD